MVGNNDKIFSGKAESYSKYRPTYPNEILNILIGKYGITNTMEIADIGCGTGILSRFFLENGNKVTSIDPNEDMLEIAKKELKDYHDVKILKGYAEKTGLKDNSVNMITVGQAFHWFKIDKVKTEFKRILKGPFLVSLIWNDRENKDNFTSEYENICTKYSRGYHSTGSTVISDDLISQFFNWSYGYYQYPNSQELDMEGLIGRYSSASYSLPKEDKDYEMMLTRMKSAFESYQKDGKVKIKYLTKLYVGKLQ
ncbi:Methyltransferase type 11 [mine drainage metagenome]|uniref:Methyltransferase type 11 n=1 Tax=mine drainage metagenome TaxID=410659 RepID=T1CAU4_9ZZZZ